MNVDPVHVGGGLHLLFIFIILGIHSVVTKHCCESSMNMENVFSSHYYDCKHEIET